MNLGFPSVESSMARARKSFLPPVPQNLEEFAEILSEGGWSHLVVFLASTDETPFFRGFLKQGGFEAVVFMSPVLSDVLQSTSIIHVDATFKVLPRQLQAKQLLTIHEVQNNKSVFKWHRNQQLLDLLSEFCATHPVARNILKMVMTLPLLPPERIEEGFIDIQIIQIISSQAEFP